MIRYDKLDIIVTSVVCSVIIIIMAFLFWPSNSSQDNPIDSSLLQIKIITKRLNIREEASINSKDIGDVYKDEVYTVIDHIDNDDYYWYKIKTNYDVVGYIASDPNDEYVEVISGYIDRTVPIINVSKDFLVFYDDNIVLDGITCYDEYSNCNISYDDSDSRKIKIIGTDDAGNVSSILVPYYKVYKFNDEKTNSVSSKFVRKNSDDKVLINAEYRLRKDIDNSVISKRYSPVIIFYDEDFNEITNYVVFNSNGVPSYCINNDDMSLKDEYLNDDLITGSILCINYLFDNNSNIKYFALGFEGIDNYNIDTNYFSNYFSKYYIY